MTPKEFLYKLIDLAFEEKEKGNDLFIDYMPHVEGVCTRYFKGGWTAESKGRIDQGCYLNKEEWDEGLANLFLEQATIERIS